jgi:hypothetical protein
VVPEGDDGESLPQPTARSATSNSVHRAPRATLIRRIMSDWSRALRI